MCCKNDSTYSNTVKTFVCEDLPDGKTCLGWYGFCESGIYGMDGLCTSEKLANKKSECGNWKQCESGECALSKPVAGALKMCCKNDSKYDFSIKADIGEDLPDGSQCFEVNDICESGISGMDGLSLCTSEKLACQQE